MVVVREDIDDLPPPRSAAERKLRYIGKWVVNSKALYNSYAEATFYDAENKELMEMAAQLVGQSVFFRVRDDLEASAVIFLWKVFDCEDFGAMKIFVPDQITRKFMAWRMPGHEGFVTFVVYCNSDVEVERAIFREKIDESHLIRIAELAYESLISRYQGAEQTIIKKLFELPEEFLCRESGVLMKNPVCCEGNEAKGSLLIKYRGEWVVNTGVHGYIGVSGVPKHLLPYEGGLMKKRNEVPDELLRGIIYDWAKTFLSNPRRASKKHFYGLSMPNIEQTGQGNHSIKVLIQKFELQREERESVFSDEEQRILDDGVAFMIDWSREYVTELLREIRENPYQSDLFKQLRVLTRLHECAGVFVETDLPIISTPGLECYDLDSSIYTEATAIVRNTCLYFAKELDMRMCGLVPFLVSSLKEAPAEARGYAADGICYLCCSGRWICENIGTEVLRPLIWLVKQGGCRDAYKAANSILVLCNGGWNRSDVDLLKIQRCLSKSTDPSVLGVLFEILLLSSKAWLSGTAFVHTTELHRLFQVASVIDDRKDLKNCLLVATSQLLGVEKTRGPVTRLDIVEKEEQWTELIVNLIEISDNHHDGAADVAKKFLSFFKGQGWIPLE